MVRPSSSSPFRTLFSDVDIGPRILQFQRHPPRPPSLSRRACLRYVSSMHASSKSTALTALCCVSARRSSQTCRRARSMHARRPRRCCKLLGQRRTARRGPNVPRRLPSVRSGSYRRSMCVPPSCHSSICAELPYRRAMRARRPRRALVTSTRQKNSMSGSSRRWWTSTRHRCACSKLRSKSSQSGPRSTKARAFKPCATN